jgi:hypothetical protein
MSQFSLIVHRFFGAPSDGKTASQILGQVIGNSYNEIEDLAGKVIVAMQHADANHDNALDKREIVSAVVYGAANALGHQLPGWLVNWFVEELVARVKIPDFKVSVPGSVTGSGSSSVRDLTDNFPAQVFDTQSPKP